MPHRRLLSLVLVACVLFAAVPAGAQTSLPLRRGTRYSIKVDSSQQQAAIYVNDRTYGIQGYTPTRLRLPRGAYKLILELPGFKAREVPISVRRAQAFSIALERASRPAVVDLRAASDDNALGGQILVDGTSVGTLPNRVEVSGGKHVVEVKKAGFNDYRDNIEVADGETRTLVVSLVAQVKPGAILVTADVPAAVVFVDGQRRDSTPALISDLPEGLHTVEVRVEGGANPPSPWKQVVSVVAGQQAKVQAQLRPAAPPPPAVGSIKILSATPSSEVLVDGEPKGPTGLEIKSLSPGNHIVEVRAQGFLNRRQEVQVAAGELRVLAIDLEQVVQQQISRLRVISPIPDVEIFVDGASVGRAPVDRGDMSPGKHFVVARKPGLADYQVQVDLQVGKTTDIAVELKAAGSLRVVTNVPGANVFLDGTPVGKTPLALSDVRSGEHIVGVSLAGYLDVRQTVRLDGGAQQILNIDLESMQTGPTVADLERAQREQSSLGALTIDRGHFNVDLGAGYPYFVDARLIAGVAKVGRHFGFDLGVGLRSNFYFTDAVLRPRIQIMRFDPFALGLDMVFAGGGGPSKRNDFSFEVGPIATLVAGQYVHVNFRPYLAVATDRLCPSVSDIKEDDSLTGTRDAAGKIVPGSGQLWSNDTRTTCRVYSSRTDNYLAGKDTLVADPTGFGQADPRERFVNVRFMLQASIEVAVSRSLNIWGLIEGAPFQGDRWTFTDKFNSWFPASDFPIYGRAGVSGKF